MNLTKSIIDQMVTYIDFADIREFVKNYPELVRLEEISKKKVFTSFILINDMSKIKNLDCIKIRFERIKTKL